MKTETKISQLADRILDLEQENEALNFLLFTASEFNRHQRASLARIRNLAYIGSFTDSLDPKQDMDYIKMVAEAGLNG